DGAGARALAAGVEEAARARRRVDGDDAGRDGAEDFYVVLFVGGDRGVCDACDVGGGRAVVAVEGRGRLLQAGAPAVEAGDARGGEARRQERDGKNLACGTSVPGLF